MEMNENLNLYLILKYAPKGTCLYTPLSGDVYLIEANSKTIIVQGSRDLIYTFDVKGRYCTTDNHFQKYSCCMDIGCQCLLFPSNYIRDWSKFKMTEPKRIFSKPFLFETLETVLVRDGNDSENNIWKLDQFISLNNNKDGYYFECVQKKWKECIPYNKHSKHLLYTNEEAPYYYNYWNYDYFQNNKRKL